VSAVAGQPPLCFTDPIAAICESVLAVAPGTDRAVARQAACQAAPSLRQQRQLASALVRDTSLLTTGRPGGPRSVELLIRALREGAASGAQALVLPRCAVCQEPRPLPRTSHGQRVCTVCMQRESRTARPCGKCGRVLQVRFRDSAGNPRCYRCPPAADSPADPLDRVVAQLARLAPQADPGFLAGLVKQAVPQAFQLRELADAIDRSPGLLTGDGASGSARLIALLKVLAEHQVPGIVLPPCPLCGRNARLPSRWNGVLCCGTCYSRAAAAPCARCGGRKPTARRSPAGEALCAACANADPSVHETCSGCGRQALITARPEGGRLCSSCCQPPAAVCSVCGKSKPCYLAGTGSPRCENCSRKLLNSATCTKCGKTRPVHRRTTSGGPLCDACSAIREPCAHCGKNRRVVARSGEGPLCQRCYRKDPMSHRPCLECGQVGPIHHHGLCADCACPELLRTALADGNGKMRPELEPVLGALLAADRTRVLAWMTFPAPQQILNGLASGRGPVAHKTLDALQPEKAARWLRAALVSAGVLPQRDEHLEQFARWSATAVSGITDLADRKTVRSYVTWHHLRLLRQRAQARPVTWGQMEGHRQETRAALQLLTWLREHDRTLSTCTQRDIDQWLADGPTTNRCARSFLRWATASHHALDVTIPAHGGYYGGSVFIEDDHRWELARRLINDTGLPAADRVAGLLVLCYAQPATRIITITTSQVTRDNGRVSLLIGDKPLHLPPPLDTLTTELVLNRRGQAVIGHTDDTPWLFPGALPGRHLSAARLGDRLKALGIQTRPARNAALIDLAAQLPAAALAQLLGIHPITAAGWTRAAGNTSPAYAAELSRRNALARPR
jgi:hypothetical protein